MTMEDDDTDLSRFIEKEAEDAPEQPFAAELIVAMSGSLPSVSIKRVRLIFLFPKVVELVIPLGKAVSTIFAGLKLTMPRPVDVISYEDAVILHWCTKNASDSLIDRQSLIDQREDIAKEYERETVADIDQINRSIFSLERIGALSIWGARLYILEKVYIRGRK